LILGLWKTPVFINKTVPIQWVRGALTPGLKRPGLETDHSPPSSTQIKNACSSTSTTPVHIHGVVLNQGKVSSSCRRA